MKHSTLAAFMLALLGLQTACGGSQTTRPDSPAKSSEGSGLDAANSEDDNDNESEEEDFEREYGKFVRVELITTKPAAAAAFYEKLLGWNVTPGNGPGTFVISNKGADLAQIRKFEPGQPIPAGWMSWLSVEDIDDLMRDVPANAGRVLSPPTASDPGRLAVVEGPTGGVFGVIQLRGDAASERAPKPGDLVLSQLWTRDFDRAVSFYSVMGDYNTNDVTLGKTKYSVLLGGGVPRALIRRTPSGRATRWIPFVLSPDVDNLIKRAKALGAKVITAPRVVPTIGRIGVIEAPTGGIIGFITPDEWESIPKDELDR